MTQYLSFIQLGLSVLLIIAILLQKRGAGSSALMGGGSASYYTKRGFEKVLFYSTIVLVILFLAFSIIGIIAAR
jgi:protein translocase SecG subunit